MTKPLPISIVIIAKNEEEKLPDCLASVTPWAAEVIVVDDESNDKTVEIAKQHGAKILTRKMDIEGRQRNFAYAEANQEWVFSLDADERVSPELYSELKKVITQNDPEVSAYSIPIKTFIGGQWIKAAGYYPASKLRLHRKGKFRYEETRVHPRAFLDGKEKPLKGDIIHYGYRDFDHFFHKLNKQTTLEAEKWVSDGRKMNGWIITHKTIDRFFRHYILKKGYTDGFMGLIMSLCHSLYQLFTYAKYWEYQHLDEETRKRYFH